MYFAFLTGTELLMVLAAVVVLFGATRIPQLGASLGQGIRNFREAVSGKGEKDPPALNEGAAPAAPKPAEAKAEAKPEAPKAS